MRCSAARCGAVRRGAVRYSSAPLGASLAGGRKSVRIREEYVQFDGGLKGSLWDRESPCEEKSSGRSGGFRMREREGGGGAREEAPTPTRSIRYANAHQLFGNGDESREWEGWPVGLGRSKMVLEDVDM